MCIFPAIVGNETALPPNTVETELRGVPLQGLGKASDPDLSPGG